MTTMSMSPVELEVWAKILTGRDRRGNIDLLNQAEKQAAELSGEVKRLEGQIGLLQSQINLLQSDLSISTDKLEMWREVLVMTSGGDSRSLQEVIMTTTARRVPEQIVAAHEAQPRQIAAAQPLTPAPRLGPVSRPLNFSEMLVTTDAPVHNPPKPRAKLPADRVRRVRRKLVPPSIEEFATWYNLVVEEFKVYPIDEVSMAYFSIYRGLVVRIRHAATEANLIPDIANAGLGKRWKAAGVTLKDIEDKLGKFTK